MKKKLIKLYLQALWHLSKYQKKAIEPYDLSEKNIINDQELENTLILVPHADDEWIGCSQVLKKSKTCTLYYFNFLGNNYNKENEIIRLNELKKLQEKFGFNLIVSQYKTSFLDLENLILSETFSSIYIPFPIDWHSEHLEVNEIFISILEKINKTNQSLFFYHISVPIPHQVKIKFLPLSISDIIEKNEIFNHYYISQKNIPIKRLTVQNKLSAIRSRYYAVEIFSKMSYPEWKLLLTYVMENYDKEIQNLSHIIDNVIKVRQASNKIYHSFLQKETETNR